MSLTKMEKTNQFIEEMHKVKKQLQTLENIFLESYEDYLGNEFDEQNLCASEIENMILMLTHELGSEIGFGIKRLETLLKYFAFRKNYKDYTDKELLDLIDKNLSILRKKEIAEGKKEKNITKIISDWNTIFENIGYEKLKGKLRLKTPYNTV
ncbi:hypothetical protein ACE939_03820 [Aquimarina sp. W85]|uniref:hypothetical protein n=1 Tax=Aquimarina rhodophyticola TaxID=3342246 RepID=UPI00366CFC68